MRIRSIKPEFWRSEDISSLRDWNDRFLFIGLWSYVDDNGVGLDRLSLIATDLFADDVERDPQETFARVSRGLQNLSDHGRITRYRSDGKDYLHITNWTKHQRIDKPNKARYPLPTSENVEPRESVAESSRESRESPAPGAVEQRSSGSGDKRSVAAPRLVDEKKPNNYQPHQLVTQRIHDRVNGAITFKAVMGIVKWALEHHSEQAVEDAGVGLYELGKPITRQTMGQYLSGHIRKPQDGIWGGSTTRPDAPRDPKSGLLVER